MHLIGSGESLQCMGTHLHSLHAIWSVGYIEQLDNIDVRSARWGFGEQRWQKLAGPSCIRRESRLRRLSAIRSEDCSDLRRYTMT